MMMIDWLKEETTWHLDICMHTSMMNFKKYNVPNYVYVCAVISKNDNSSQRILVNYGFILARSHSLLSLLGGILIEREKENRYFTLIFLRIHTRANTDVNFRELNNCQNKIIFSS
jgi:hypothetical protein